jgi:hypothetical protein
MGVWVIGSTERIYPLRLDNAGFCTFNAPILVIGMFYGVQGLMIDEKKERTFVCMIRLLGGLVTAGHLPSQYDWKFGKNFVPGEQHA